MSRTPARFKVETKYTEVTGKKANTNLPVFATVGNHFTGVAGVVGRPGWYHIRLGPDPGVVADTAARLTQCKSEGVALGLNDYIYVIKTRDRDLTYYEFHSFIQTAGGLPVPPVCPKWAQVFTVSVNSCQYRLVSDAVAAIAALAALPVPIIPSAASPWLIQVMAGDFDEGTLGAAAANVTIVQHIHIRGRGESTVLDMDDYELILQDDTSMADIVVLGNDANRIVNVTGDNAVMWDTRIIAEDTTRCLEVTGDCFEGYHIIAEALVAGSTGFYVDGGTALLWDCKADDTTYFSYGLYVTGSATVTTKFCEFRVHAKTNVDGDVVVIGGSTWRHFCCNFDPDNCSVAGTETPLIHGKTNFDDVVTFEDGFTFDGVSAANIITLPDNLADALHIIDDGAGDIFLKIITTTGSEEVIFNDGEDDVDFRVAALSTALRCGDPTYAFAVSGQFGTVGMGIAPSSAYHLRVHDDAVETTASYYGANFYHEKTAGATDQNDNMYGLYASMAMNHNGSTIGNLAGLNFQVSLVDGTVGTGGANKNVSGITGLVLHAADGVTNGNVEGVHVFLQIDGGTIDGDVYGVYTDVDIADIDDLTGDVYGHWIRVDDDEGADGTVYMLYLDELTGIDYGVYQNGAGLNYFGGNTGVGVVPTTHQHFVVEDLTIAPTLTYYGIDANHIVTDASGATEADDIYGARIQATMNDGDDVIGHLYGVRAQARLQDGTIGDGEENIYGMTLEVRMDAGTANNRIFGSYSLVDLDAGTVAGDIYGSQSRVDIEDAMTSIGGSVYGVYVWVDADQDPVGSVYMVYLNERTGNIDYGFYQTAQAIAAPNYLGGRLVVGTETGNASGLPILILDQPDIDKPFIEFQTATLYTGKSGVDEYVMVENQNGDTRYLRLFS